MKKTKLTDLNKKPRGDAVNSPAHYTAGKYETIDVIEDILGPEKFEGYCIGNVIKYVSRYPHKNGTEDLKKAGVYLNWAINARDDSHD